MPSPKKEEKALTLSQLIQFFNQHIEPRFQGLEKRLEDFQEEFHDFKNESQQRFDQLYKLIEDLKQEYVVANFQMKRLEKNDDVLKQDLADLKNKVIHLQEKIEEIERSLQVH